jgi:uncharacterized protein YyaL (SSP411 family)
VQEPIDRDSALTDIAVPESPLRDHLYTVRSQREWPTKDEKVIASWNGLMIRAFVDAARAFGRDDYREAAQQAGRFLGKQLVRDGRVFRSALGERVSGPGVLEDFAAVGLAFLDLYSLTFETNWLQLSRAVTEKAVELPRRQSILRHSQRSRATPAAPRDVTDNATPSGTSLMAVNSHLVASMTWPSGACWPKVRCHASVMRSPSFPRHSPLRASPTLWSMAALVAGPATRRTRGFAASSIGSGQFSFPEWRSQAVTRQHLTSRR